MADQGEQAAVQPADSQTRAREIENELAAEYSGDNEGDQSPPEAEAADAEEPAQAADAEAETSDDGLEEVEFEGEKAKVPLKFKEGLLREADYRRKTQEIAKQRQVLDTQLQALNRQHLESKFMESVKEPLTEFNKLSAQIDQYQNLDWRQLSTEEMLRARAEIDRLERERSKSAQSIEMKRGEFARQQEQLYAELVQKGEEVLRSRINGWNETLAKEVADYAISEGYPQEEVKNIVDPRYAITLWKAKQWDTLQANKGKALKQAQSAQQKVVKPGAAPRNMPAMVKENLAFRKALKAERNPSKKARLIEDQLARDFERRH